MKSLKEEKKVFGFITKVSYLYYWYSLYVLAVVKD